MVLLLLAHLAADSQGPGGLVSAKKKKDKKSKGGKIKIKYKVDDDDRRRVGCEPHKFTFRTFEDSWCSY